MSDHDSGEAGIHAYLQHQAQERRAVYVAEGRRYAALAPDALEAVWAEAYVALCLHGEGHSLRDLDDLTAEIGLRGRPVPAHLVQHVLPAVRAHARQWLATGLVASFSARVGALLRHQPEPTRQG